MTSAEQQPVVGEEALAFQACRGCGAVRYFRRPFCPRCGSADTDERIASGHGTVHAVTTVHRAPSAELRAYAPYCIALVDAAQGFRFMAHAAEGLAIGDAVRTRFADFGGRRVPVVDRIG